jgi:hypothetical protein
MLALQQHTMLVVVVLEVIHYAQGIALSATCKACSRSDVLIQLKQNNYHVSQILSQKLTATRENPMYNKMCIRSSNGSDQ